MKAFEELPERVKEQNPYATEIVFKGPTEDIYDLKCLKGRDDSGMGYVASYWYLNESEKEALKVYLENGAEIIVELTIIGEGIPPVAVNLI